MKTMIKPFLFAAITLGLFQACKNDDDSTNPPTTSIPETITISETGLYPEGIDFNTSNNQFIVGSITRGELGYIDTESGAYTTFVTDENLVNVAGVLTDEVRNRLLAVSGDVGLTGAATAGSIGYLGIYNLEDGALIQGIDLKTLTPDAGSFPNDIAVDKSGNIYVTDSFSPVIYKIDSDSFEASILVNGGDTFTPAPGGFGLNGIVYLNGILVVNKLDDGALFRIPLDNPSGFKKIEAPTFIGADGLEIDKKGNIVLVENALGTEPGAHILTSSDDWNTATLKSYFAIEAEKFPTTASLASDGEVYVLNSYLNKALAGDLSQEIFTIKRITE